MGLVGDQSGNRACLSVPSALKDVSYVSEAQETLAVTCILHTYEILSVELRDFPPHDPPCAQDLPDRLELLFGLT